MGKPIEERLDTYLQMCDKLENAKREIEMRNGVMNRQKKALELKGKEIERLKKENILFREHLIWLNKWRFPMTTELEKILKEEETSAESLLNLQNTKRYRRVSY